MKDASKPPPDPNNAAASRAQFAEIAAIALSIPSSLVAPFIIGYFIDDWLHTQPVFFLVFGAIGAVSAGIAIFQLWKKVGDA